jgi:uncharacterized protein (TIGR04222 family)
MSRSSRLCTIVGALVLLLLAVMPVGVAAQDVKRDRLAPLTMEAPPFASFPAGVLSDDDASLIYRLVLENREFGVPHAVRVISVPTSAASLPGPVPSQQEITQRLADEWIANEPIESSPGADDGILLLVVIPADDHAQTTAAYATGANALPQNGLTRPRLDAIVRGVMEPYFRADTIGTGIAEGTATLSYENLFLPSPGIEVTGAKERLQTIANLPLAALTAAAALALLGAAFWLSRRGGPSGAAPERLSPFAASAIARGRVDDAVTTGAVLHLIELGALTPRSTHRGVTLAIGPAPASADPFVCRVWEALRAEAQDDPPVVAPAAMRRLPDVMAIARREQEDDLTRRGLLNRNARRETLWVGLACFILLAVAVYTLTPAIIGLARWGVFAAAFALVAIGLTLWWLSRRSWATAAGHAALRAWTPANAAERELYDTIVEQDDLLGLEGGLAATTRPVQLVRTLRGLGAA